jgi:hypothetical protein
MPCHENQATESEHGGCQKDRTFSEDLPNAAKHEPTENTSQFEEHREAGDNCDALVVVDILHAHGQQ